MVRASSYEQNRAERMSSLTVSDRKYQKTKRKRDACIYLLIGICLVLLCLTILLFSALILIAKRILEPNWSLQQQNHTTYNNNIPSIHHHSNTTSKILNEHLFRLPPNIIPIKYDLIIHPNLNTGTFNGRVSITLNISAPPTQEIKLHGKYLSIQNCQLTEIVKMRSNTQTAASVLKVEKYEEIPAYEMWSIKTNRPLQPGLYELIIVYNQSSSTLNRSKKTLVGFYNSVYYNYMTNSSRSIATSKFEPTYARQAFPCFDEPNMKAKYSVKLVRPTNEYVALSNMNQISEEKYSDTETVVTFQESVPMSTYLSCFIVCDFDYTERIVEPSPGLGDNITFRVYATPAQKNKTLFALDTGASVLKYYIDYFQIPYPLPKLDMAAIPDFSSGAMETWGLVTYRETALLYSPETSSVKNMERVATVVAHELAHMWFGNLVTMEWWNELWLNEGFATFIEYLGVDYVHKDWEMENTFIISELHQALNIDATLNSHPIVVAVRNPDEITAVFDAISYSKGASLLRMLRSFVGHEEFRQGVTDYLKQHMYGNAKSQDLFNSIQKIVGDRMNVTEIMNTWIKQMGFPEVLVVNDGPGVYKLTQRRFLLSNSENEKVEIKKSEFDYKWTIPITYITNVNNTTKLEFFNYKNETMTIKTDNNTSWIKLNVGQNGFYRVNYELDMWKELTENYMKLSIADRTSLLSDAFNLARASRVPYSVPLDLAQELVNETDMIPWRVASESFGYMQLLLFNTETYVHFRKYVLNTLNPVLSNINWNVNESDTNILRHLRISILNLACKFGESDCLDKAGIRLKRFCDDPLDRPHQDIRRIVFKYGMWHIGTEEEWNILWERYLKEDDAQVKENYRAGLSFIRDPTILQRYIRLAWNPEYVRRQDYFSCLITISENPIGTSIVWDHVRENWMQLVNEFGLNDRYLGRMVQSITSSFTTETKLQEMKDFFKKYPDAGAGETARKQAIEKVENNIKWLKDHLEEVDDWLIKNVDNTKSATKEL